MRGKGRCSIICSRGKITSTGGVHPYLGANGKWSEVANPQPQLMNDPLGAYLWGGGGKRFGCFIDLETLQGGFSMFSLETFKAKGTTPSLRSLCRFQTCERRPNFAPPLDDDGRKKQADCGSPAWGSNGFFYWVGGYGNDVCSCFHTISLREAPAKATAQQPNNPIAQ